MIPGVALFVLVLGINLLGDGLRDLLGAGGCVSGALLEVEDLQRRASAGDRCGARRLAFSVGAARPIAWWASRAAASR